MIHHIPPNHNKNTATATPKNGINPVPTSPPALVPAAVATVVVAPPAVSLVGKSLGIAPGVLVESGPGTLVVGVPAFPLVTVAVATAVVLLGVGATTVAVVVVVGGSGSTSSPVRVGTAYGGSKRPKRPQALQGYAHELTWGGAARMGLQRGSLSMVAMAVGSAVCGQSVPRSLSVSCLVTPSVASPPGPGAMVETSSRSSSRIQLVVAGPARSPSVLVPTAVGISM